ncbi:hypothetical protein VNO77_12047 [Canavalia gladiata]|uniref:Uncharacterized protein n=1 Tax=Canavalia gladiata TaxID=3824 RepID=A0AAN9QML5_CANGL
MPMNEDSNWGLLVGTQVGKDLTSLLCLTEHSKGHFPISNFSFRSQLSTPIYTLQFHSHFPISSSFLLIHLTVKKCQLRICPL